MKIEEMIRQRDIKEVLHFTTNLGMTGSLYSKCLKSRKRLEKDKLLEYIFSANANFRKDPAWLDFINLSISRINSSFYDISANRWHAGKDIWWCIFSFSPKILTHQGVFFATTNNMYTSVKRMEGAKGLQALYASSIERWRGKTVKRNAACVDAFPTCEQAEVLYPGELSTRYLQKIYVACETAGDEAYAQLENLGHSHIKVKVDVTKFGDSVGAI